MGCKTLMLYATKRKLYKEVCLREIADQYRRKTGEEPVIAVDGPACVRYLYGNRDYWCGGQYKEFREACRNFVREFRNCGVRLVFFFHGIKPAEKTDKWVQVSKRTVETINQMFENLHVRGGKALEALRLLEGLIPCARVIFRDEPSAEVRLCMVDFNKEAAQYAASCKDCLGVLSSNGNFLVYSDVPSQFPFNNELRIRNGVRMWRFFSSDVTADLGIEPHDMPTFATFLGNETIHPDELRQAHERLGCGSQNVETLCCSVAQVVKNKTISEICQIAFGDQWREFLERVKVGIGQYEYKPRASDSAAEEGSDWSRVLKSIELKHELGAIPAMVLSVARCRTFRIGPVLEDLSQAQNRCTSTGEALQPMRRRMYTVLLWESGDGPFLVKEQVTSSTEAYLLEVEVQKSLPPNVVHPGLLQLWTGDVETRWRLFGWIVGAPDPEGSALRSLEPQYLAVPAAALSFLRHEAHLLSPQEAEVFAVVAVIVAKFTPQQLAQKRTPRVDPHGVYLATLFVRTVLHVLDAAAVCGLSFPQEADCQLAAYFDGKLFQELYLKAKAQSFPRVGSHAPGNPSYLQSIHKLLDVIEGIHTDEQ